MSRSNKFILLNKPILIVIVTLLYLFILIPTLYAQKIESCKQYKNLMEYNEPIVVNPLKEGATTLEDLNIEGVDSINVAVNEKVIKNNMTLLYDIFYGNQNDNIYEFDENSVSEVDYTKYVNANILNVRELPNADTNKVGKFINQEKVRIIGEIPDSDWVQVKVDGKIGYINSNFLVDSIKDTSYKSIPVNWGGTILNSNRGVAQGPSGKETYYNLNMSRVVNNMKRLGYNYEYWVRDDGVKMFGNYVMVAANLNIRPKGTILETSRGLGIVCDTGDFAKKNAEQLDLAVTWN